VQNWAATLQARPRKVANQPAFTLTARGIASQDQIGGGGVCEQAAIALFSIARYGQMQWHQLVASWVVRRQGRFHLPTSTHPVHSVSLSPLITTQGSSTTVSRSDIRLIQHLDSSAHGLVRRLLLKLAVSLSYTTPHTTLGLMSQPQLHRTVSDNITVR
jgi:hypothetical protein